MPHHDMVALIHYELRLHNPRLAIDARKLTSTFKDLERLQPNDLTSDLNIEMSILYTILKGMNGGINVTSSPNDGTSIKIDFKLFQIAPDSIDNDMVLTDETPPEKPKLLLIDNPNYI